MNILKYFEKKEEIVAQPSVIKEKPKKDRFYFDYAAITPIDPAVEQKMQAVSDNFCNPSSLYTEAVANKALIGEARKTIATFFNVQSDEIIFTASGTEANNLAILGVFNGYQGKKTPHFIVSAIEHPSVLEACLEVERLGAQVTYVLPEKDGTIDPKGKE